MKKLRHILLLVVGFILVACTTDVDGPLPDPGAEPTVSRHGVPVERALEELDDLLGVIDAQGTRSGGVRRVAEVQSLHSRALPQTRSGVDPAEQPEELLYVVNFEGGQGYAVLGADDRLPGVLLPLRDI